MSTSNDELPPVDRECFHVAPLNGKATRLVIFRCGNREFRDQVNVDRAAARNKFLRGCAETIDHEFGDLKPFAQTIVELADEADQRVAVEAQSAMDDSFEPELEDCRAESNRILEQTDPTIIDAAAEFLVDRDIFGRLNSYFQQIGIVGELILATTVFLVAVSRLLQRPLGAIIQSASSSGKSFISNKVIDLVPPEEILKATDISDQALYYLRHGSLRHKLVVSAERKHGDSRMEDAMANSTLALREMMSSGELTKVVTVTDTGQPITRIIRQPGPIAFLQTTCQEQIFSEDETRLLPLITDESCEQTTAILEHQAQEAAGLTTSTEVIDRIRNILRTAQRMLFARTVRIPFAPLLRIPSTKVKSRRAFQQLLGVIQAVAFLRQHQKEEVDGCIEADADDYDFAYQVMQPVLCRVFAPLSSRARELHECIRRHLQAPTFTRTDCVSWSGLSRTEVRNRIELLIEAGLISQTAGGPGVTCRYQVQCGTATVGDGASVIGLVTPTELRRQLGDGNAACSSRQAQPTNEPDTTWHSP